MTLDTIHDTAPPRERGPGGDMSEIRLSGAIPGQKRCVADNCDRPHIARGYCHAHYRAHREGRPIGPLRTDPVGARLPSLIDKSGHCWEWLGGRDRHGYGRITYKEKTRRAHRVVYEHEVGPIPDGLVLDHLCRNHGCVNPAHLEPVTDRVNVVERGRTITAENARKAHCKHGHAFDDKNTRIRPNGSRACRACARARDRKVRRTDAYRAKHAERERERRKRRSDAREAS